MIIKKTFTFSKMGTFLGLLFFLSACSSSLHESNNINEDLKKLSTQDIIPAELPIIKREFISKKNKNISLPSNVKNPEEITSRKLYFSLLYEQYEELSQYIDENDTKIKAPEINSCPQFHSNVVAFKERIIKDIRDIGIRGKNIKGGKKKKYVVENYPMEKRLSLLAAGGEINKGLFPELSLPLSPKKLHPTVQEILSSSSKPKKKSRVLEAALRLHMERNYRELKELCEYGQSDHSYIFENLITYMKSKEELQEKPTEETLQAFMKVLIFSNMTLLTSLSGEIPYDINDLESYSVKAIKRVQAPWFTDYLGSLADSEKYLEK